MNQTYRIVGWMTELEMGLTVEEWKQVLDHLDPELDYLPFEISQANATIIGLIDRELVEEWDREWGCILSGKLEPLSDYSARLKAAGSYYTIRTVAFNTSPISMRPSSQYSPRI